MDFKTLEAVIWIHRLGSFRAAADRMNTTQPALSHRIQQLELDLGVSLFLRQRPKVTLTEPGREFLRYAEQILELRSLMITAVGGKIAQAGVLRLGAIETVVHTWLPTFVGRMAEEFPRLELEIEVDDSPTLKARLSCFELDLVFVAGAFDDALGRGVPLSTTPVIFVRASTFALPDQPTLKDLAGCPIVTFSRTSQLHPIIHDLFAGLDVPRPRLHTSSSMATILRMALDGIGVAVVPAAIVTQQLQSGELIAIDVPAPLPTLAIWAVWLRASGSEIAMQAATLASQIAQGR
jgi:DNA-binding transcriptional LysR family regulator